MDCSGKRNEVGKSTGGKIFESKCMEDNGLEVGVADKVIQLSHHREFVVRVQARVRRRRKTGWRG